MRFLSFHNFVLVVFLEKTNAAALKSLSVNFGICQPSVVIYCLHSVGDLSGSCCGKCFSVEVWTFLCFETLDLISTLVSWLFDTTLAED